MRKIAIATWFNEGNCNYGQTFQAFATMRAVTALVRDEPIEVEVINYRKTPRYQSRFGALGKLYRRLRRRSLPEHLRAAKFNRFVDRNFALSRRLYTPADFISYASAPEFQALIAGSDQIWNPQGVLDDCYFFPFATNARKISYASSLTSMDMWDSDGEIRSRLEARRDQIEDFHALAARESDGAEILDQMTSTPVHVVLDPVFLLSKRQWEEAAPAKTGRFLLVYWLGPIESRVGEVEALAERHRLKIVFLSGSTFKRETPQGWHRVRAASPEYFLSLFQGASFVCTDSFHGTAFSIILRKDFCVFSRGTERFTPNPSRVSDLLKRLGAEDRLVHHGQPAPENPPNYPAIEPLLADEITRSTGFLQEALGLDPLKDSAHSGTASPPE